MMKRLLKVLILDTWNWWRARPPLDRLLGLTAGLIIFLLILPPAIRNIFWNSLLSHRVLASMLIIFSLLAISLLWSTGQRMDVWVFLLFNKWGLRSKWLDRAMLGITQIGSGVFALGIALVYYWTNQRLLAYKLVLGTLTLWMVVELFKFLFRRSRPFIRLTETRIVGYQARGLSFPSGHTSQAFFLATLLTQHLQYNPWITSLLYLTALAVGVTRIFIGAHYPRDVLAGAVLGSAWGILTELV